MLAEANAAGIARDVSVAVITDLVNGKLSADEPPPTGENPDQDIGEPDAMANKGPHVGQDVPIIGDPVGNPLDQIGYRRGLR